MALVGRIVGWVLITFGVLFLAVELDQQSKGESKDPILGLVLIGLFLAGGGLLVWKSRAGAKVAPPAPPLPPIPEHRVFQLAEAEGGRITAVEVAAGLGVGFDQARDVLEDLERRGACQSLVNDAGTIVYRFAEFEGPEGKRDLLEG